MKNKVLFVYSAYENIGIEYLSASLKNKGFDTDLLFFPMLFEDSMLDIDFLARIFSIENKLIREYDFSDVISVCFNVPTDYYRYYLRIAQKIKKKAEHVKIIFGGIHSSSTPDIVLQNDFIDYVALGEGERSIIEIQNYILGKTYKIPQGFIYQEEEKIINTGSGECIKDLDDLIFPDKDIFYDKAKYLSSTYTIFTSRGCPYSCSYCINNFWYDSLYTELNRVRRRSVDNVIEELRIGLEKYNYKSVMFEDDVFVLDENWHWDFIEKYKKYINKPFVCVIHPNHCLNIEILMSLKEAGCIQIEIGIQTLNEKVRKKYLNRYETNKTILTALQNLNKTGIKYNIDHIAGLPEDTLEFQELAAKTYSKYRPNRVLYFFITNYPSTEIESISIEKNIVNSEDVEKMHQGFGETDETTGSVEEKAAKELERLRFMFGWLPVLPHKLNVFIINSGIYRFIPIDRIFTKIIPSILATLTGGEPRGEVMLKKYLINIFNFKWMYKFK